MKRSLYLAPLALLLFASSQVQADEQVEIHPATSEATNVVLKSPLDVTEAATPAKSSSEAVVEKPSVDNQGDTSESKEPVKAEEPTAPSDKAEDPKTPAPDQVGEKEIPKEPAPVDPKEDEKPEPAKPTNTFMEEKGKWYYLDEHGEKVTGWQDINGQHLYFRKDGQQVKGVMEKIGDDYYYFDQDTGEMWKNRFVQADQRRPYNPYGKGPYKEWFYLGDDGKRFIGEITINGETYRFADNEGSAVPGGEQVKHHVYGKSYYHDSGRKARSEFVYLTQDFLYHYLPNIFGTAYFDADGNMVEGLQVIKGRYYYFDPTHTVPTMVTDRNVTIDGKVYHFLSNGQCDSIDGVAIRGQIPTGWQEKNGRRYYYDKLGNQIKGQSIEVDGGRYYLDPNSGKMVTNHFVTETVQEGEKEITVIRYYGADGKAVTGEQTIKGKTYLFDQAGVQQSNYLDREQGKFYGKDGRLVTNRLVHLTSQVTSSNGEPTPEGRVYFGEEGVAQDGPITLGDKIYHTERKAGLPIVVRRERLTTPTPAP